MVSNVKLIFLLIFYKHKLQLSVLLLILLLIQMRFLKLQLVYENASEAKLPAKSIRFTNTFSHTLNCVKMYDTNKLDIRAVTYFKRHITRQ